MLFPDSFRAPKLATLGRFQLRLLVPGDAQADFQVVRESAARLRGVFGPDNPWPPDDLSFETNLADLARHEQESHANLSFAYSVWQQDVYAGCLYIKPFKSRLAADRRRGIYRELCFLWVAESFVAEEAALYTLCRSWVQHSFPLTGPVWPGRELDWAQWQALAG